MADQAGVSTDAGDSGRVSLMNDPKARGLVFQALLIIAVIAMVYSGISNAVDNLARAGIASGFGFFSERAGFDVGQSFIPYTNDSTYLRAFFVGLLNTLVVAVIGIFFATTIGFIVGLARLSKNYLVQKFATVYVETLRNIPLLLQLLFWYKAVLSILPSPRESAQEAGVEIAFSINNRGMYLPRLVPEDGSSLIFYAAALALVAWFVIGRWAKKRQMDTGKQFPVFLTGLGVFIVLPLLAFLISGRPVSIEYASLQGFNMVGGWVIQPEFMALLLGLSLYTASFIAEIVRAGILAVSHGQTEAAFALGIRPNLTSRLVIVPQAMRVIIPPLTSQFLNLTKNSSLAVAIGYPDLVSIFGGTVLNQTGQAVEVISITMLVYLTLSLLTSAFMNWFNSSVALVER
ncbi:amine acid ABC transporter, permease protein, 3-TM region, His/Glu/Gln/Arg/opine family [Hoeflea sp. IMCC20628]|uniref:amino acid ABC transporter permease n=1 Tax=Hoeflea sp. IMCC20628 TaxID=1620421 RepID=UPI00063A9C04|nr:amino acid ABC transporter permease [Hoeflea sp. IMCC20628]AKI00564.1 amine acid ABC transporter, permease protein, 3-TM region, His/Glu/Gln/Arg/opine family [Hoeflea sp. IMCC20628]